MRTGYLRQLTTIERDAAAEALEPHVVADQWRSAAWIAWTFRRQILRDGAFAFRIHVSDKTPDWFRVAVEEFRRRQRWNVVVRTSGGIRSYVIQWLEHGQRRRSCTERATSPCGPRT